MAPQAVQTSLKRSTWCHHLPIRDERLQQIRNETATDATLQSLKRVIIDGWPSERDTTPRAAKSLL